MLGERRLGGRIRYHDFLLLLLSFPEFRIDVDVNLRMTENWPKDKTLKYLSNRRKLSFALEIGKGRYQPSLSFMGRRTVFK